MAERSDTQSSSALHSVSGVCLCVRVCLFLIFVSSEAAPLRAPAKSHFHTLLCNNCIAP